MKYLINDYLASGEGRTINVLITNRKNAKEIFTLSLGEYFSECIEEISREEMISRYERVLPKFITTNSFELDHKDYTFEYSIKLYMNRA